MPRAPRRCSPSCSKKAVRGGRCEEHQPPRIPWVKSEDSPDRSYLRTAEWLQQRRRILWEANEKKGGCQLRIPDRCTGKATTVDHIMPVWYVGADKVEDDELQGLCEPCHNFKSSRDGYFAKMAKKSSLEDSG